jgi:hypothetical protein
MIGRLMCERKRIVTRKEKNLSQNNLIILAQHPLML